jgi:hypothetical protein
MKNININAIIAYTINLFLGIIGFFLVTSYNKTNEVLAQINRDILSLNKEMTTLKLEMTEMNVKMMTDDRVRELIRLELMKN